jgi:hypothetical protein
MLGTARLILLVSGLLIVFGGVVVLATGGRGTILGGLTLVLIGAALAGSAALERLRYRSDAQDRSAAAPGPAGGEPPGPPEPRFERTAEVFVDPTSQLRTRVFLDRRTGERRYQAED